MVFLLLLHVYNVCHNKNILYNDKNLKLIVKGELIFLKQITSHCFSMGFKYVVLCCEMPCHGPQNHIFSVERKRKSKTNKGHIFSASF